MPSPSHHHPTGANHAQGPAQQQGSQEAEEGHLSTQADLGRRGDADRHHRGAGAQQEKEVRC